MTSRRRVLKLSRWRKDVPLTLTVKWRGGAQGWIEVRARGGSIRVPSDTPILFVLEDVWEGRLYAD